MYKTESKDKGCSQPNNTGTPRPLGEPTRVRPFTDQEPRLKDLLEHKLGTRKPGQEIPGRADVIREVLEAGLVAVGFPRQEEKEAILVAKHQSQNPPLAGEVSEGRRGQTTSQS